MPKRSESKRSESTSVVKSTIAAVPWLALTRAAMIVSRHWNALSSRERASLTQLVGESRGRVGNLSSKQRTELRKLAGKLDLAGMGRELFALRSAGRGKRGRKRR